MVNNSSMTPENHADENDNDNKRQKTNSTGNAVTDSSTALISSSSSSTSTTTRYKDYTFYRYEQVEDKWLSVDQPLPAETLCWVTHSRGKKRKNARKLNQRAHVITGEYVTNIPTTTKQGTTDSSPLREEEPRIQIRYPKGSTFHVRRSNLLPVLQEEKLVIVTPETNLYRRWSIVHTRPHDSYVEIGCDFGMLVQKVWEFSSCPQFVTGLDKAPEDITEAQKRYPGCNFRLWNVPLGIGFGSGTSGITNNNGGDGDSGEDQTTTINNNVTNDADDESDENGESTTAEAAAAASPPAVGEPPLPMDLFPPLEDPEATIHPNLVVSIDINGNRELEAVQECVEIVIREWKPRLIVVKSRELYAHLLQKDGKQQQQQQQQPVVAANDADAAEEENTATTTT